MNDSVQPIADAGLMDEVATDQPLVSDTHFDAPTVGRVKPGAGGGNWVDVALG